jgi:hypothetical protein
LNSDGTTNNVMIGSVVIQPIESGKFGCGSINNALAAA